MRSFYPSHGRRCAAACSRMLPLTYAARGRVASRIPACRGTQSFAQKLAAFGQVGLGPARGRGARFERGAAFVAVADRPRHPADVALLGPVPPALALLERDRAVAVGIDHAELGDEQGEALGARSVGFVAELLAVAT